MQLLLMGYRQELIRTLHQMNVPYHLWSDKEVRRIPATCLSYYQAPFPRDSREIRSILRRQQLPNPITHVLACTESAVFPAAFARRFFGARAFAQSVLIRCSDKVDMKLFVQNLGVEMTDFHIPRKEDRIDQLIAELGLPLVIKERDGSGSRNLVFANGADEISQNMGPNKIYERFVDAPEGSVETFINRGQILFTNVTEYHEKRHVNIVPAHYSPKEIAAILELNRQVIQGMQIQWGMTHLEFYRSQQGILFGEIALRPPGGYIMELMRLAYNFNPWEAFLAMELDLPFTFPQSHSAHAASCLFHPGTGKLITVEGQEVARKIPGTKKLKVKVKALQTIEARASVNQDVAYALIQRDNYDSLIESVDQLRQTLRFRLEPKDLMA